MQNLRHRAACAGHQTGIRIPIGYLIFQIRNRNRFIPVSYDAFSFMASGYSIAGLPIQLLRMGEEQHCLALASSESPYPRIDCYSYRA
jgi:hypothetical protein